jgi:hypothetical protein
VNVDERVRALEVAWPAEPDVAAAVRARLEVEGEAAPRAGRRPFARRYRPALIALLVALGVVAAVPSARSTVLDWLGIGGETIQRVPKVPTPKPVTFPLDLGPRVPLPRDALVPRALGRPDAVYEAGDIVTLLYRPRPGLPESEHTGAGALVSEFPGRTNSAFVRKMAGPHTRIDRVTVGGEPGFWIAGADHGLLYEDPSGAIGESRPRLAGDALVWRHGGRTLRLEADIPKSRALAVARSVR